MLTPLNSFEEFADMFLSLWGGGWRLRVGVGRRVPSLFTLLQLLSLLNLMNEGFSTKRETKKNDNTNEMKRCCYSYFKHVESGLREAGCSPGLGSHPGLCDCTVP